MTSFHFCLYALVPTLIGMFVAATSPHGYVRALTSGLLFWLIFVLLLFGVFAGIRQ